MREHDNRTIAHSTRRALLKIIPGFAAASVVPAAAIAAIHETLDEKRDRLFAELGAVLEASTGTRWNKSNDRKFQVVVFADSYETLSHGEA